MTTTLEINTGKSHLPTKIQYEAADTAVKLSEATHVSSPPTYVSPSPIVQLDTLELQLLRKALLQQENRVLDNWWKLIITEMKDVEFVKTYIVPRQSTPPQNSGTLDPTIVTSRIKENEGCLRQYPPASELLAQVRYWFEEQLDEKSKAVTAISQYRQDLFRSYRHAVSVLEAETSDKIRKLFLKYQVSNVAVDASTPTSSSTSFLQIRQEIQSWLQTHYINDILDAGSAFQLAQQPKSLLSFLLLLRENVQTEMDRITVTSEEISVPVINIPDTAASRFRTPQEYKDLLQLREQKIQQATYEHRQRVNALKDKKKLEMDERRASLKQWTFQIDKWIQQVRVLEERDVVTGISEWQNTILRQRNLSQELRRIMQDADAKLRNISLDTVNKIESRVAKVKSQYLANEMQKSKQIEGIMRQATNIREADMIGLRQWMRLRETLWNDRQCLRVINLWAALFPASGPVRQ